MEKLLLPVANEILGMGTLLRYSGAEFDRQGCFMNYDADRNLVLINIIDLKERSLVASSGVIKPQRGESVFRYISSFRESRHAAEALALVRAWPLYKKNEALQSSILQFVKLSYVPEQILDWRRSDSLDLLFVPIQQKFRIGRFTERRSEARVCKDKFREWLDTLRKGDYITYIAQIMKQVNSTPRFYSIGTRPHEVTHRSLESEGFNFKPTHGGHIKAIEPRDGVRQFIVDAGSTYIGRGVKSSLYVAKEVTDALKRAFPDYNFTPLEGREAFGQNQSY